MTAPGSPPSGDGSRPRASLWGSRRATPTRSRSSPTPSATSFSPPSPPGTTTLRECTLTDLAKARGLAKSTCSETLHRAEGRVLRRFVAGEFDDEDSETSVGKGIGDESEREPDRDGHHRTVTALGT